MSFANFTFSIYKIQETWIISETLRTLVHVIVFLRCMRCLQDERISKASVELASSQSITSEKEEEKSYRRRYMHEREEDG